MAETKKAQKKNGRPKTTVQEKLNKITFDKEKVLNLVRVHGFKNEEVAKQLGVSEVTFQNWVRADEDFSLALKRAKDVFDSGNSEISLKRRVMGYTTTEKKIIKNGDGEVIREEIVEKEIPPDTTAIIFSLKNRDPERWKDRHESDVNLKGAIEIKINYSSEGESK